MKLLVLNTETLNNKANKFPSRFLITLVYVLVYMLTSSVGNAEINNSLNANQKFENCIYDSTWVGFDSKLEDIHGLGLSFHDKNCIGLVKKEIKLALNTNEHSTSSADSAALASSKIFERVLKARRTYIEQEVWQCKRQSHINVSVECLDPLIDEAMLREDYELLKHLLSLLPRK